MDSGSVTGAAENCRQNSVEAAAGNCRQDIVHNRVRNPEKYSQVWKGDNQSQKSCGKLQHCAHDRVMHERSCGKLQHCAHDHVVHVRVTGNCWQDTVQGNMPESSRGCGKLHRKIDIQLQTIRLDHHNMQVTAYGYLEKVFVNLRRQLNRTEDDEMFDLKTNVLISGLFMSTTMKSAVHLGLEDDGTRTSEGSRRSSISL